MAREHRLQFSRREIAHHKCRDCGVNVIKVPGADYTATATTSASAAMTATIAMKAAASKSDMNHIIAP
jgi:hypothetical protein